MDLVQDGVVWCPKCEFLENSENVDHEGSQCQSCGCDPKIHFDVLVVKA